MFWNAIVPPILTVEVQTPGANHSTYIFIPKGI